MAYEPNMAVAANRHYEDGRGLVERKRFDNAGYHYGLAAECAIKGKLLDLGVPENDNAIWKHWPELKTLALLSISGRRAAALRALLSDGRFMQGWEVKMRYSDNGKVSQKLVDGWENDANRAIGLLL